MYGGVCIPSTCFALCTVLLAAIISIEPLFICLNNNNFPDIILAIFLIHQSKTNSTLRFTNSTIYYYLEKSTLFILVLIIWRLVHKCLSLGKENEKTNKTEKKKGEKQAIFMIEMETSSKGGKILKTSTCCLNGLFDRVMSFCARLYVNRLTESDRASRPGAEFCHTSQ